MALHKVFMYNMQGIQVNEDPEVAMGRYACEVFIRGHEREICIDFISVTASEQPQGQLVSRIYMNRIKAEEFLQVLNNNLRNWEKMRYESVDKNSIPQDVLPLKEKPTSPENL